MWRDFLSVALLLSASFTQGFAQAQAPAPAPHRDSTPPAAALPAVSAEAPLGFAAGSRESELKHEARALAVPSPESARRWLKTLTEEPHIAGSPADHRTALFVRDRLKEWGWTTEIVPYEVLLNYPAKEPQLQLTRPVTLGLNVAELPLAGDKDSASSAAFGAFHGYGISGIASGQVVYVNYGRPEDFAALEKLGVSVRDRIVLARYGGNFRGLKVLNAQQRGARGILIYSDPGDDGYAKGDVYPDGPYRPGSAVQRGSVQFLSMGPGDPSTPGGPSRKGADRLPIHPLYGFPLADRPFSALEGAQDVAAWEAKAGRKRSEYFATIPSLPISYNAAREILARLAGPTVPAGWQGGLPLAYHVGAGPAEVTFSVSMDYRVRTIWNVIATLPGSAEPDHWIMLGNHRDAWVFGAVDPGSGTAATLETCRALGAAARAGWKPRRTIVYASWDAEEYGLVGSTEWAEEHAGDLDRKAALMLNVDSAVGGRNLDIGGVPSLRDLALNAASAVSDVRTGRSLRDLWTESRRSSWASASPLVLGDPLWEQAEGGSANRPGKLFRSGFIPQLQPLGSGSDYTVFLDHLGVPSLDADFSGGYGVYHSIYDSFTWMEKHGDPEFVTHAMAARLYTVFLMRAAGAEVLPLRFVPYGEALRLHVDELRLALARRARARAETAADGSEAGRKAAAGEFDGLPRLVSVVQGFQRQAHALDRALDELASVRSVPDAVLSRINAALVRVERSFLLAEGLPGRPWFKHAVYAPGVTTGYGAWPLPAIRQAVEENKPERIGGLVGPTAAAVERATAALGQVLEHVPKASPAAGTTH